MPKVSQAHLEARRAHILDAARICFARDGLHGATFAHIVAESGLSAGAIYRYFASKDDIIEALSRERHVRENAAIRAALEGGGLAEGLKRISALFFGALEEADEQARRRIGIQLWAEALSEPRVMAVVREGTDEPRRLIGEAVTRAQAQGLVRGDLDADAVARLLIALYHGFVLQRAWEGDVAIAPFLAAVEAALGGLMAGQAKADVLT